MRNLIAAVVFVLPSMAFGKTVTLTLGSAYAKPGWTVDLPLTLSGGANPAALQWSFGYSSDITGVTVVASDSVKAAGKSVTCSGGTCLMFGVNAATLPDGGVAVATFQVAAKPSSTTISIAVNSVVAAEANGSAITASGVAGKISLAGAAPAPGSADLAQLKFYSEVVDWSYMERRLHPRAQVQFETKVTDLQTHQSGLGRTCDISESGLSVMQSFGLAEGDLVQLEMADSVLTGRVAYSNPEGAEFRVGIEVHRVQLGHSNLSNLLQKTLIETMPTLPGVEYAERG